MSILYFKDFLRYRSVWMGVAMIWIVLYHCSFTMPIAVLDYVKGIGYGGVDICLFASGIGCYYSLTANPDVGNFMKRRLQKLMPTYLIFIVFWLAYQIIVGKFNYRMAIGNIFAVQLFTGHGKGFNWYISAILFFYLLAPYLKAIVDSTSRGLKVLTMVFLLVGTIPFWDSEDLIVLVTRIAIFYIGLLFGKACKEESRITPKHISIAIFMIIAGLAMLLTIFILFPAETRWMYGLFWYPFILITPPLCMVISYVAILLEKTKITKCMVLFLNLVGSYSFEIYLIHLLLVLIIEKVIKEFGLANEKYLVWLAGGVVLVAGCFVLRKVATICEKSLFKSKKIGD